MFFVPSTELRVELASPEERARYERELDEYWSRKPELAQHTGYGGVYDRQYCAEARHRISEPEAWQPVPAADGSGRGATPSRG